MANKFLGALGLDVLVNKIKDVITELSKKLSAEDVFSVATVDENGALVLDNMNIFNRPIIKVIDVKNDNGTIIRSPGDYVIGFLAIHHNASNSSAFWTTSPYGVLGAYDSVNFIDSSMIAGADWTINDDITVRYNGNKLQVKNASGNWVDFEFPAGTTVEEITADEVTNKFA